jgi:hypothetical protein
MNGKSLFSALLSILFTVSALDATAQAKSGGQCVGDIIAPFGVVDIQDAMHVLNNFNPTKKQYSLNSNADINVDGLINGADLAYVTGSLGPCPKRCQYDYNGDKKVNAVDLAILLSQDEITGKEMSGLLYQWGDCDKPYSQVTKRTPERKKPALLQTKPTMK